MKMKSLVLSAIAISMGVSGFGWAGEVSHPISISDSDILRNEDGSLKLMSHHAATVACPVGTHLPSAREFANYSQTYGVKLLGFDQLTPEQVLNTDWQEVTPYSPDGSKKEFFYEDYSNYQRPKGDLGERGFWTSSTFFSADGFAYSFVGYYGFVDYNIPSHRLAVACIKDH